MSNPKISVIVPVYNVEKYLSECLDSIINQTLKDIEIICVNDGSTDNSFAILKEYAQKDSRIQIIDKENEGQGYARKVGLEKASGEYILFCDSDDYYAELTAFEELYDYMEKIKVDVLIFNHMRNYILEGGIEKISGNYPQKEIFSYLDMNNIFAFGVTAWLKLYSRKFLNSYGDWYFPKNIKYEDMPFHFQIFTRARMAYIDKYFYTYRLRVKSTTTSPVSENRLFDLCKIFKEIYNITKKKCNLSLFFDYFYSNLFSRLSNYQIKSVEVAKYIIDTIKQFDISKLSECKNRNAILLIKIGLRLIPEDFMEYLNKKNLKIKNIEIFKLKEIKQIRETRIKRLNEQLKQKNETIVKRDEVIKTKNETISKRDEVIKTKNEIISKRDEVIKTKNEAISKRDEVIKTKNETISKRDEVIKTKNEVIAKRDEVIKIKNETIAKRDITIKDRDSVIKQKKNEIQNLHNRNKNLSIQNKKLCEQNNIQEQVIKRLRNSWSYRIGRLFTYPLSIPLDFYRFIRDYNLIKKSGLFDSEYYLSQNEDVKKAKINPIKHYLKFGWKEGRNPSSKFNGNEYLNERPDVRVAGICPLVHYIKFGKDEELSFIFEKIKNLEIKNKTLENNNKKFENDNKNLEKKLNEKSVELEQLNRKKSEADVKFAESKKDFEKLNKKIANLENFERNILITYKEGINKDKISFEIEQFLEFSKLGITNEKREPELIVSLTSYPARIHEVYYTIFSLLTQNLKPNRIILWLAEEQFPNRNRDLPKNLLQFIESGITIKYTNDVRPYKKLIPALREYPNAIIVTADDDIFYPNDWLEKLYNCWKSNKDCIICNSMMKAEITKDKKIIPFNDWKEIKDILESSLKNFAIGAGGVLYPPNCFYKDICDEELFMKLVPTNDDIWFWAMAVLNDTKRKQVNNYQMDILLINPARERNIINESCLWKINCVNSNNQNQIQLDNVINYYPQIMEKLLEEEKQNE